MSRPLLTWHLGRGRVAGHGRRITGAGATRGRMISEAGRDIRQPRVTAPHLLEVSGVLVGPRGGSEVFLKSRLVSGQYSGRRAGLMLMAHTRRAA